MVGRDGAGEVLVLRPSRAEFSRPFTEYVRKVLKAHPGVPMFKVVPPPGWRPRKKPFPSLDTVEIATPIKQIVYGKGGAYRCILVEQKPVTAARFKEVSESEGHTAPESRRAKEAGDDLMERCFWSSITINPPLYGADTPQSFFDKNLEWGWNLRHLEGCLLHRNRVPHITGVTSPMTYFGMYKSFFSWHLEDADLYSINYLHFGAPKVWYCVSPAHKDKFERMCQGLYPTLHRSCHAFMRHKDVMLSPQMLKTHGIPYTMAKQEANEFIVLNAAAYHAGYNLGFNCAEAINFAMPEWIDVGRAQVRCNCGALKEGVRLSMRHFGVESDSDGDSEDEETGSEGDDEQSEEESEEQEDARRPRRRAAAAAKKATAAAAATTGKKVAAAAAAAAAAPAPPGRKRAAAEAAAEAAGAAKRPKGRETRTALAAADAARRQRSGRATAEARAKLQRAGAAARRAAKPAASEADKGGGLHPTEATLISLDLAAAAAANMRAAHEARAAAAAAAKAAKAAGGAGVKVEEGGPEGGGSEDSEATAAGGSSSREGSPGAVHAPAEPTAAPAAAAPRRRSAAGGGPPGEQPRAIVGESARGRRFFYLVQPMGTAAARGGGGGDRTRLRWLREGPDGLFHPTDEIWDEPSAALVNVRCQWVPPPPAAAAGAGASSASAAAESGGGGGWRLLTLRSRILEETELVG